MTRLLLIIVILTVPLQSAFAVVTEFEDLALDGGGTTPFIRWEHNGQPDYFMVRFNDNFSLWTGAAYSCVFHSTAGTNALVVDGDGTSVAKSVKIRDIDGVIDLEMSHADSIQTFGIRSLSATVGQNNGGIGVYNEDAYPFFVFDGAPNQSLSLGAEGVGVGSLDAQAPLHVYADGTAFDESKILIENDMQGTPTVREMLSSINNGGSFISLVDTHLGSQWNLVSTGAGALGFSKSGTGGSELLMYPNGRVVMGLGGAKRFDLRANGNLFITGTLMQSSDKNRKTAFADIDENDILERVGKMPVQTWQFKSDKPELRHIGPTSQDFRAAFGLGQDEKTIAPVDGIGVSLAAIKALKRQSDQKDQSIKTLSIKAEQQEREIAELRTRLEAQQKQFQARQQLLLATIDRLDRLEIDDKNSDRKMQ